MSPHLPVGSGKNAALYLLYILRILQLAADVHVLLLLLCVLLLYFNFAFIFPESGAIGVEELLGAHTCCKCFDRFVDDISSANFRCS